jgi:tetratricopeptide (TPR) repeat protein
MLALSYFFSPLPVSRISTVSHFNSAVLMYWGGWSRYAEAHCNLGVIHKEEGRLEAAIGCYERALALAPEFAIVRSNLAIALTEQGTRVKLAGARTNRLHASTCCLRL